MWERLHTWGSRALAWLRMDRVDREFAEELDGHTADLVEQFRRRGLSDAEALRQARILLGGVTQLREAHRELRGLPRLDRLAQDLHFAARMFAKTPGFTAFAGAALALGIGATTAVFTVADTVLIRPLPYREPSRLVMVWQDDTAFGFPRNNGSPWAFTEWRRRNRVLLDLAALTHDSLDLIGRGDPQYLQADMVTVNFFDVLGVGPAAGRTFINADGRPGAPLTTVLSHHLWTEQFGADPAIVGQNVVLSGATYIVIGVMPPAFHFLDPRIDIWTPAQWTQAEIDARKSDHFLTMIGRLRPGLPVERASVEMRDLGQQLATPAMPDTTPVLVPLREQLAGDTSRTVALLVGAVAFLLLIACANLANLLLARGSARTREMAVRLAIGASRARIVEQMLVESVLLSVMAAVPGLWLGTAASTVVSRIVPRGFDAPGGVNLPVLTASALVSVATGLVFGILPALRSSRLHLASSLRETSAQAGGAGRRLRGALVVTEVAVATILLSGATLMLRSFDRLLRQDPGFHADHVLTAGTRLPMPKYQDPARRTAFYRDALQRLERLPGVEAAGFTTYLPLANTGGGSLVTVENRPPDPDHMLIANVRVVTPGYFRAVGMTLRRGRLLTASDSAESQNVVVINESMARTYWPGVDAIGRRFKRGLLTTPSPWYTVAGIVADMRQGGMDIPVRPEAYFPVDQAAFFSPASLAIRTSGDPVAVADLIRRQIWAVDPAQPVSDVVTLDRLVGDSVAPTRVQTTLVTGFAATALLLAALGIYAVLSFTVTQRIREIGIRMAVGARPWDILRLVVAQATRLVAAGGCIGLAGALALSRVIGYLLFDTAPTDPASYASVAGVLFLVTLLACAVPVRRATTIDPLRALRWE